MALSMRNSSFPRVCKSCKDFIANCSLSSRNDARTREEQASTRLNRVININFFSASIPLSMSEVRYKQDAARKSSFVCPAQAETKNMNPSDAIMFTSTQSTYLLATIRMCARTFPSLEKLFAMFKKVLNRKDEMLFSRM